MKVIIIGCGRVGEQLARLLVDEGHQVVGDRLRCQSPGTPGT